MKGSHAVFSVILALLIGYAGGYATFLIRFPFADARPTFGGAKAARQTPAPVVHPLIAEVEKARKLQQEGKLLDAQKLLLDQLHLYPQAVEARPARTLLGEINTELYFSEQQLYGKTEYLVQRGDSLARIARKLNSSPEMIMRANNLDSTTIHTGDRLLVPDGNFTLTIDVPRERVIVYHDNGFFKQYPIKTIDLPASSQLRISTKVSGTTFWKDGERVMPTAANRGDATAWVQLDRPGYILYGVSDEGEVADGSIEVSDADKPEAPAAADPDVPPKGIALLKDDLAELQLLLSRGTQVTIVRERH